MLALIDSDIFQWEFGTATDDEFKPLSWPLVQSRIQGRINGIMDATGADKYELFITSDDKSNFRYEIASIQPYKAHRQDLEKPYWYTHIRNFLVDHRGAQEVYGQEADDAMSIAQWKDYVGCGGEKDKCNTIICSRDKDLNMVPGWHFTWGAGKQKEKGPWFQDEIGGLRCFYGQLLTGDAVDNIPGLYGVGKSSVLIKRLQDMNTEEELYNHVLEQYKLRFGTYAEKFLVENARLLWMRKEEDELWDIPLEIG